MHRLAPAGILAALAAGTLPALGAATVSVDTSKLGPAVTAEILGANMANWFDPTQAGVAAALKGAGFRATRWPGGSESDEFHWASNSDCDGGYANPNATFANFAADVVKPAKVDLAITVDYGSNAACNGGGDPVEAAAWVTYAKTHNIAVSHWTIGNEVYGSWEYDLHAKPNDAATYAAAVATGFYPAIKAANAKAKVGVVVEPGWSPAWDPIVLAKAKYDFVEYHFYAQAPGSESDSYLLTQAPQALTAGINAVKADLAAAGHAKTPIYVGELGSVYANPGKQSTSITQALFAGQVLGELMNAGVSRATWWLAFGGCNDASSGNFSPSLYGGQNFGGYMLLSDGTPEYGCPNATSVPLGTDLPTARAFEVMATVLHGGDHALTATAAGAADLRAYALTQGKGTALILFNLNETTALPVDISIGTLTTASGITVTTYDKAIYDQSQSNVWAPPATQHLGATSLPATLTLTPWSMNAVVVTP